MAISGPIALYSNLPIRADYYKPRRFEISDITLGATTIITSTDDFDYAIGQQVRILIPIGYGCQQINKMQAYVLSLPLSNQVEIDINSLLFNQFLPVSLPQKPQIVAIGDVNSGAINLGRTNNITFIDGSFINISPQ